MGTKTAMRLLAPYSRFTHGLCFRCAAAATFQCGYRADRGTTRACYADAALAIDDGVSDAGTVGKAVSARCRKYTDELILGASSGDPKAPAQYSKKLMKWPQRMSSSSVG